MAALRVLRSYSRDSELPMSVPSPLSAHKDKRYIIIKPGYSPFLEIFLLYNRPRSTHRSWISVHVRVVYCSSSCRDTKQPSTAPTARQQQEWRRTELSWLWRRRFLHPQRRFVVTALSQKEIQNSLPYLLVQSLSELSTRHFDHQKQCLIKDARLTRQFQNEKTAWPQVPAS